MNEPQDSEMTLPRPSPPPLRVHHLLVWMAFSALMLTMSGLPRQFYAAESPVYEVVELVWRAGMAILYAAALTLTLLGIGWRWRGLAYFDQPGQWLLAVNAFIGVSRLIREAVYRKWFDAVAQPVRLAAGGETTEIGPTLPESVGAALFVFEMAVLLGAVGLCLTYARSERLSPNWRRVFYWKAVLAVVVSTSFKVWQHLPFAHRIVSGWFIANVQIWLYAFTPAIALGLLAWAAIDDRRAGRHWHWTHSCGVVVQGALHILYLITLATFYWLR